MAARDAKLTCERESATLFAPLFANSANERLVVSHLDGQQRLLAISEASSLHRNCLRLPLRIILTDALAHGSCALIIAHNHPSGDPTPSRSDMEATRSIADILKVLEIRLFDHLILAKNGAHASFRRLGLL